MPTYDVKVKARVVREVTFNGPIEADSEDEAREKVVKAFETWDFNWKWDIDDGEPVAEDIDFVAVVKES